MDWNVGIWGLFWGILSASSLPLGAAFGLWMKPQRKLVSALMAFGAGALLFALSVEIFGHTIEQAGDGHGHIRYPLFILVTMGGAVIGGLLFEASNQILSRHGAHVRNRSLLRKYIVKSRRKKAERLLRVIARNRILQVLSEEETVRLTQFVQEQVFPPGHVLFREGDAADAVYFIVRGQVLVEHGEAMDSGPIAVLGPGDILGEIALISKSMRTAGARAQTELEVLTLTSGQFEDFLCVSTALRRAVRELAESRSLELVERNILDVAQADEWRARRMTGIGDVAIATSDAELDRETQTRGQHSATAIWLGNVLDSIPEAMVIGMLVVAASASKESISLAFPIGVFLANFPEAMSSAVTMRASGGSILRTVVMWTSLCVLIAIGALLSAGLFPSHPDGLLRYRMLFMEGLAAGAMLTMIAETMLPEAFEQGGGTIVGLSTLGGFLAALAVKLIP